LDLLVKEDITLQIQERYDLTRVINAAGTFTPLGVSRSSAQVGRTVAEALSEFFVMDELQEVAGAAIARMSGAQAGAVTHCVAAGITLSVAAAMAGSDPDRVAALPDTSGLPNRVVLPAGHAVDYGHSILQDVRLAGATPVIAGSDERCSIADIEAALAHPQTACLLLMSSRLVRGEPIDLSKAVAAAHHRGVPAIIDGAAQDMRVRELVATGADLVLVSAHKYLASPTAGLVIGSRALVRAVRAHEKGIGRAMKPSKEGICGVLVAIEERDSLDLAAWRQMQEDKVAFFVEQTNELPGVSAAAVADSAGMPFSRAHLEIDPARSGRDAAALAHALKSKSPSIRVMEHGLGDGRLILELVPLDKAELETVIARLTEALVVRDVGLS